MSSGEYFMVGIAAGSCAGKTSLAHELATRIDPSPTMLSFDEYDLYPTGSPAMSRELTNPTITNWEDPKLFDEQAYARDLRLFKEGTPVELQTRSRESIAAGEEARIVTPGPLNIVEGIFAYRHPRTIAWFDLRIFIDLPAATMVERRLAGRSGDDPWDNPEYIQGSMLEGTERFVLPQRDFAHIVLDGRLSTEELADEAMNHIMRATS